MNNYTYFETSTEADFRYDNSVRFQFDMGVKLSPTAQGELLGYFPMEQGESLPGAVRLLLGGRRSFDLYFSASPRPEEIRMVVAADTGNPNNSALRSALAGDTLLCYGVSQKEHFFITGVKKVSPLVGSVSNRCVHGVVTLHLEGAEGLIPEVEEIVRRLPAVEEHTRDMEEKLSHWEEYLRFNEKIAMESEITLDYDQVRPLGSRGRAAFFCPGAGEKQMGLSVQLVEQESHRGVEGPLIGQVAEEKEGWLVVALHPAYQEGARFPKKGRLHLSQHGDVVQLRRLRKGLQRFSRGQAANPYLDVFFFDAGKARPMPERGVTLEEDALFLKQLNRDQRRAVEGALSAPDLFLIQGPPGTGKTTVIAEICYQNALRGGRTLIAAQTNLAVDNVLSRLVKDPKIRALRKGTEESVQAEGKPFTQERVIETWLEQARRSSGESAAAVLRQAEGIRELERKLQEIAPAQEAYVKRRVRLNRLRERKKQVEGWMRTAQRDSAMLCRRREDFFQLPSMDLLEGYTLGPFSFSKDSLQEGELLFDKLVEAQDDYDYWNNLEDAAKGCKVIILLQEIPEPKKLLPGRVMGREEMVMRCCKMVEVVQVMRSKPPKGISAVFQRIWRRWRIWDAEKKLRVFFSNLQASQDYYHRRAEQVRSQTDSREVTERLKVIFANQGAALSDFGKKAQEKAARLGEKIQAIQEELQRRQGALRQFHDAVPERFEKAPFDQVLGLTDMPGYYRSLWQGALSDCRIYEELSRKWRQTLSQAGQEQQQAFLSLYLRHANVIGITCSQSATLDFERDYPEFDMVIVDEVSKATPPELILPLLKGKKVVLVGDHRQLPPMLGADTYEELLRQAGKEEQLSHMKTSLFEKLYEQAPESGKVMLRTQYRMHSQIMEAINQFYHGRLICGIADDERGRAHSCQSRLIPKEAHLLWVDAASSGQEQQQAKTHSYYNPGEAACVKNVLRHLNEALERNGFAGKKEVGVITFYSAQAQLLEQEVLQENFCASLPHLTLRVGSVDQFQGVEQEIIVCSFVRNNQRGDLGFAKDPRRINVAMSRAKELMVVVGSAPLFAQQEEYAAVQKIAAERGGMRHAVDFE